MSAPPETLDPTYFVAGFVAWVSLFALTLRASKAVWAANNISERDQWVHPPTASTPNGRSEHVILFRIQYDTVISVMQMQL